MTERREQLVMEMRARADEYATAPPGLPCQGEPRWHAEEIRGWANRVEASCWGEGDPALLELLRQEVERQKKCGWTIKLYPSSYGPPKEYQVLLLHPLEALLCPDPSRGRQQEEDKKDVTRGGKQAVSERLDLPREG